MHRILTAAILALALALMQHPVRAGQPAHDPTAVVTPVAGPSWLHHLRVDIRDTNLGRGAGRYGPNPNDPVPQQSGVVVTVEPTVTLSGSDLYRLNCQACHRASGTGSAPEIKSVLPMVQGSSRQQMTAVLRHKADQARADLYTRIETGGQRMPAREYMQRSDIDVLYSYLTALAGDSTSLPKRETVSADRLGEFVVKGTCHICHDASGPRPSPEAMLLQGSIPHLPVSWRRGGSRK